MNNQDCPMKYNSYNTSKNKIRQTWNRVDQNTTNISSKEEIGITIKSNVGNFYRKFSGLKSLLSIESDWISFDFFENDQNEKFVKFVSTIDRIPEDLISFIKTEIIFKDNGNIVTKLPDSDFEFQTNKIIHVKDTGVDNFYNVQIHNFLFLDDDSDFIGNVESLQMKLLLSLKNPREYR